MNFRVAPTAIDRSIARRRRALRRRQSLRRGAPVGSGNSARWRTGMILGAWKRPLTAAEIDGAEFSLRPPQINIGMRSPAEPHGTRIHSDVSLILMRACRRH